MSDCNDQQPTLVGSTKLNGQTATINAITTTSANSHTSSNNARIPDFTLPFHLNLSQTIRQHFQRYKNKPSVDNVENDVRPKISKALTKQHSGHRFNIVRSISITFRPSDSTSSVLSNNQDVNHRTLTYDEAISSGNVVSRLPKSKNLPTLEELIKNRSKEPTYIDSKHVGKEDVERQECGKESVIPKEKSNIKLKARRWFRRRSKSIPDGKNAMNDSYNDERTLNAVIFKSFQNPDNQRPNGTSAESQHSFDHRTQNDPVPEPVHSQLRRKKSPQMDLHMPHIRPKSDFFGQSPTSNMIRSQSRYSAIEVSCVESRFENV